MPENKIEKFIKNNNLDFSGSGSDLNSSHCIICGYALYIGIEDFTQLLDLFVDTEIEEDTFQFENVWDYANHNYYEDWWKIEGNRNQFNL